MRWSGLVVASFCLVFAMLVGSGLTQFLNLPSIVLVLSVGFGTVFFGHGRRGLALLFRATFHEVNGNASGHAAEVARTASRAFISLLVPLLARYSWLGLVIGIVQMLAHLDDFSKIGPALALALLTVFYGQMFSTLLWMPTERRMDAKVVAVQA